MSLLWGGNGDVGGRDELTHMSLCHLYLGTLGIFQLEGIRMKGLAEFPSTQGQELDHRGFSGAGRGAQHHPVGPAKSFSMSHSKVLHSSGLECQIVAFREKRKSK